ncbi:circumsporozoite protein-like [Anopheles gambiae]|uniref:circumsporozoite protein-like n=1 Tax=Anopheles gambiae TaxID=7165 RepID=UPI002AC8D2C5|nr:circumsporozoite protein-like [Anopheles gambiae]
MTPIVVKPTTNQLTFLLEDMEVDHDLKLISRSKPISASRAAAAAAAAASSTAAAAQHSVNDGASGSTGGTGGGTQTGGGGGGGVGVGGGGVGVGGGGGGGGGGANAADQNGGSQPAEGYGGSGAAPTGTGGQSNAQPSTETRIEDGKLWYERRWFHRGQPVHVEGRDIPRFPANISAIGTEAICVKKTSDGQKVRIFLSHLRRGKVSIKRRAN